MNGVITFSKTYPFLVLTLINNCHNAYAHVVLLVRLSMSDQDKYSVAPARDTENIRKNYNDDAHKMRAKAAKARIKAKQKEEKDARQRAAIEKIPPEHRILEDSL